jgi:hypothetical protein
MAAPSRGLGRTDFVFMLVALYFILVSFFIILSTLSVRDNEKLQQAVGSIERSFKMNGRLTITDRKSEPSSYTVFLGDLQSWIGNLYALGRVNVVRSGNKIVITLIHPRFFQPGTAEFTGEAKKALGSLAELLSTWQTDYLTELEIVAHEPSLSLTADRAPSLMGDQHAAVIAAYLAQHGIQSRALLVGVQDNPEPVIGFTFIIRVPPKLDSGGS